MTKKAYYMEVPLDRYEELLKKERIADRFYTDRNVDETVETDIGEAIREADENETWG